jgi:hypothetical protein
MCINTCVLHFNKSVFNWTFCQLLKEKPNYTKLVYFNGLIVGLTILPTAALVDCIKLTHS